MDSEPNIPHVIRLVLIVDDVTATQLEADTVAGKRSPDLYMMSVFTIFFFSFRNCAQLVTGKDDALSFLPPPPPPPTP